MDDQFTFDDDPRLISIRKKFEAVKARLRKQMPTQPFERFILPLRVKELDGNVVVLAAPGRFIQTWVSDKYQAVLSSHLSAECGERMEVQVESVLNLRTEAVEEPAAIAPPISDSASERYTFENFVAGPNNQLAFNGARQVASNPGGLCNPLFVYGKTGLGKTHLLCAIRGQLRSRLSQSGVVYQIGQEFTSGFVAALERNQMGQFRRPIETCSVWLIDDVQFLDGKTRTQEEFFHLFNQLSHNGKQVVICSDRAPRELSRFEERLRSRLESGVVAEMLPPDTETRIEILKRRSAELGMDLPADVCEYLAMNTPGNVRSLIGALKTFIVAAQTCGATPSVDLAVRTIEKQFGREECRKPDADRVIEVVCDRHSISVEQLKSPSRKAWITQARHIAVYLIREELHESWKRIGERLGNRDHSSIIHGFSKIEGLLSSDSDIKRIVQEVRRDLGLS